MQQGIQHRGESEIASPNTHTWRRDHINASLWQVILMALYAVCAQIVQQEQRPTNYIRFNEKPFNLITRSQQPAAILPIFSLSVLVYFFMLVTEREQPKCSPSLIRSSLFFIYFL
jgi:hypothetical protein